MCCISMNLSYITPYHVFETGSFQDPSIDTFSPWTGSDSYLSANPPFAYTNTSDSSFFREFKGLPRSMYNLWTMTTGGSLSIAVLDQVCLGRGKGEGWGVAECLAGRVPLAFLKKKHKEHFESVVRNCTVSWLNQLLQLLIAMNGCSLLLYNSHLLIPSTHPTQLGTALILPWSVPGGSGIQCRYPCTAQQTQKPWKLQLIFQLRSCLSGRQPLVQAKPSPQIGKKDCGKGLPLYWPIQNWEHQPNSQRIPFLFHLNEAHQCRWAFWMFQHLKSEAYHG